MTEISIEGFGTGDAQDDRAQDDEGDARIGEHESQRVMRADRLEDLRIAGNVHHAKQGDHQKPDQGQRAKETADTTGSPLLHGKQAKQDDQRERNHESGKGRRHHLQALDGREHGDRWRYDPVTIKERGAEDANDQQYRAQTRTAFDGLRSQRQHGDQSTFAVVVSAQHQNHVLDRNNRRQGPEEDGQDAVNVIRRERHMPGTENFLERVQDTGPDVSVDDTDGAQGKGGERGF